MHTYIYIYIYISAPKEYLMHTLFFMHWIFGGFLVWTGALCYTILYYNII